jgi:hypothetical protein
MLYPAIVIALSLALELPPHKVTRVLKQFKAAKKFKKFEAKFESDMPF